MRKDPFEVLCEVTIRLTDRPVQSERGEHWRVEIERMSGVGVKCFGRQGDGMVEFPFVGVLRVSMSVL